METNLHVIFSMQVPNLAMKYAEYVSTAGYELRGMRFLGTPTKGQSRSLLQENSVPLVVPESGNHFPP
jgi:hypothetical protein